MTVWLAAVFLPRPAGSDTCCGKRLLPLPTHPFSPAWPPAPMCFGGLFQGRRGVRCGARARTQALHSALYSSEFSSQLRRGERSPGAGSSRCNQTLINSRSFVYRCMSL
ncbi:hypothetical protein KIL84_009697 [Mauremys mutica]|uniref:Secreted protein n=1 Tax=Mauremys mutica TaxID=74926 RepID=A0A9D3XMH6_9SAUR|nr:hypothetical protein KIL84_009697 [Mauremys mutica]